MQIIRLIIALFALMMLLASALLAVSRREPATSSSFIAFVSERDGNAEIYIMRSDGSGKRNLTHHPSPDLSALWSPDGRWLYFYSGREGLFYPYRVGLHGDHLMKEAAYPNEFRQTPYFPDGENYAYTSGQDGNREIYIMKPTKSTFRQNLSQHPSDDYMPQWSPVVDMPWVGSLNLTLGVMLILFAWLMPKLRYNREDIRLRATK